MKRQKMFFRLLLISLIVFGLAISRINQSEYSIFNAINPTLRTSSNNNIKRILSETQVNEYTTNDQNMPSICALSSDRIAVVWQSDGQDGDGLGVYATVIDATTGNNITAEFQVNDYITNRQDFPSVCALADDTFVVAWSSEGQDGDGLGVYATVIDATTGNNITSEFRVNEYITSDQGGSSICALTSDTLAVTWDSVGQDGDGGGVYAKVINVTTGNNIVPEFRVNEYITSDQGGSSICALSSNTFAVAWMSSGQDGSGSGIYASVIDANTGSIITSEFQVNQYTLYDQMLPSICALSSDTLAVAWIDYDEDGNGVYATVMNATTGSNIVAEFQVNEYTTSEQVLRSICTLSSDTFVVAWSSDGQDGDSFGIYTTVINATIGSTLSKEFQVNEYTINSQWNPSICVLFNNTFTVAWDSVGQDGSGTGIYLSILRYIGTGPIVSILSPYTGIYGSSSLAINASIIDEFGTVSIAKAMINASNPFNITMKNLEGDYWSCTWDNITGSEYTTNDYKITFWAMDNNGIIDASQYVIITIDKTGPSANIISPSTGTYSSPSIVINASIVDELSTVSSVKAIINASTPFELTMIKGSGDYWSIVWNNISSYPSGYYEITIRAIDDKGNVDQSQSVIIMIDLSTSGGQPIPGYGIYIVIGIIGVSSVILAKKLTKNQK